MLDWGIENNHLIKLNQLIGSPENLHRTATLPAI